MDRYREVERKFEAGPGLPLPDLAGAGGTVGDAVESQLDATYFDTADARLARHGITLRRRTGGEDAGWHLKLPAGPDERTEVRLPLGRATRTVPRALTRDVRAIVRDRPLVPIAVLRTTRIERRLLDDQGNALAAVADDTVHGQRLSDGTPQDEASWREVEVELLGGDTSFLDAVSDRLSAAGLTRSRSSSKLARMLGDLEPPAGAAQLDMRRGARRVTAGALMVAYLQEQVGQLVRADRGARSNDPHAVHAMRVATRRLRSTLATYRPLVDRQRTDPLRAELKWLGQVLGGSRDAEVLHRRMRALIAAQPEDPVLGQVTDRIDQELGERRKVAVADLRAALDGKRYFRLLDALDELVAHPPLATLASKRARKLVPHLVGQVARRVDRAAQAVSDDGTGQSRNAGLHEVRKCAKRARYAAESAVPVAGKDARRLAGRMESLQEVLGEHQDSVGAQALLLKLMMAAERSGSYELVFGQLYAEESGRAHDARRAYKVALRRASADKARRWTDKAHALRPR
jgi:CHAD domain-containing protein